MELINAVAKATRTLRMAYERQPKLRYTFWQILLCCLQRFELSESVVLFIAFEFRPLTLRFDVNYSVWILCHAEQCNEYIRAQVFKSEQKVEGVRSVSENLNWATFVLKFKGYCGRPELFVLCRTENSVEVVTKGGNEIATLSLASSVKVCVSNCRRRICQIMNCSSDLNLSIWTWSAFLLRGVNILPFILLDFVGAALVRAL